MKILTVFFLLISAQLFAKFQYLSPMPGSIMIDPGQTIIIREGNVLDPSSLKNDLFLVSGQKSGEHSFRLVLSSDGKTVILHPYTPFDYGEIVTVTINPGMRTQGQKIIEGFSFSFTTHREFTSYEKEMIKKLNFMRLGDQLSFNAEDYSKEPVEDSRDLTGGFTIVKNTNPTPGSVFYDAWSGIFFSSKYDGYHIITPEGDSVYSSPKMTICFDFSINPNGYLSVYNTNLARFDVLDSNYAIIDFYYPGNGRHSDPHEFTIYEDGHAFLVCAETQVIDMTVYNPNYSENALVTGTIIQEFDEDKNVIFEWRAFDHVEITESNQNLAFSTIDYVHTNSIDLDTDGNIIFSNRHLDQVNKIDRSTGDFIWRLGGDENEFTFINDPEHFNYQHDARRISNGHITLWDNGNLHSPTHSSAKEYVLNEQNMTATLAWSYQPLTNSGNKAYFYAMGGVQRLSNGNTLIAGGWDNSFSQSNLWEVTPGGEVVWELAFNNSKSLVGYRAKKYDWNPCAVVNPANINVTKITSSSAKIVWTAVANAISYDVQFKQANKPTWKLINTTNTSKKIQNLKPGKNYNYQVRANCANGFTSDWSLIGTFTTNPLKLENKTVPADIFSFSISSNPVEDQMVISLHSSSDQQATISIYDIMGKRVIVSSSYLSAGTGNLEINVRNLAAGLYFTELRTNGLKQTVKFIKQ